MRQTSALITGMKETAFNFTTEVPMDEHWKYLIQDEKKIFRSLKDGEYSKVRNGSNLSYERH